MPGGRFPGYPAKSAQLAVPAAFFAEVLPRLAARPADLVVATYAFFALGRKRGFPRYVTGEELRADESLRAALAAALHAGVGDGADLDAALAFSLQTLEGEGLLLRLALGEGGGAYFLPTPADRRGMERLRGEQEQRRVAPPAPAERSVTEPDIIAWYEGAIGTVPPMLLDELREAEGTYPAGWIEDAFREAAALNVRNWRYVLRILERWAEEGRGEHEETERDPAEEQRERYFGGRWGGLLR